MPDQNDDQSENDSTAPKKITVDSVHVVTPPSQDLGTSSPSSKFSPIIRWGGMGSKRIATILVTVLLVWGLISATLLVRIRQEIRERAAPEGPAKAACIVYAIHDQGSKDTQFFRIDLKSDLKVNTLGPIYPDYDIEGMDIHPQTNTIYAISSGGKHNGKLFTVDAESGVISEIGNTGYKDIEALSFRPTHATLWGWAEDKGLVQIDPNTANATLIFESGTGIEGLAWSNDGSLLYGSEKRNLWVYQAEDRGFSKLAENLPGETEALEMQPNGLLMGGFHKSSEENSIFAYDVSRRKVVAEENIRTRFNDVEAIAWPETCGDPPLADPQPSFTPTPAPTATHTPTPTPTPEVNVEPTPTPVIPDIANLSFGVSFQGISAKKPDKSVKLTIKHGGMNKYLFENVNTSSNDTGVYKGLTDTIETGNYDEVLVKGPIHLQKRFSNVAIDREGMPEHDWSSDKLIAGDFNNDNRLDIIDLGKIIAIYTQLSTPTDAGNQIYDIDANERIDIFDISIILSNYNELVVRGAE